MFAGVIGILGQRETGIIYSALCFAQMIITDTQHYGCAQNLGMFQGNRKQNLQCLPASQQK